MRPLTLICLVLLNTLAIYLVASLSYEIHVGNQKAAGTFLEAVLAQPGALWAIARQALAVLALHVLFWTAIFFIALSGRSLSDSAASACFRLVAVWAAATWLVLRANATLFPHSIWSWFCQPLFEPLASRAVDVLAACMALLQSARGLRAVRRLWSQYPRRIGLAATLATVTLAVWLAAPWLKRASQPSTALPRNVVIIGLDSLRRDVALGHSSLAIPHLSQFREQAYVHSNVVSPLARTFPAWTTILTGLHPQQSGARDNLAPQHLIASQASMAWSFKQAGYRTIYSTDETRFSNIGSNFGFTELIAPQPGLPDFLLGQVSDLPLVNLAIQIPGSEALLPSLVGNRAFAHAYYPNRYLQRLQQALGPATEQPTFLAIHLCLAHWPFFDAQGAVSGKKANYHDSAESLDAQFGNLTAMLTRLGYLNEETLVVVLADHGESHLGEGSQMQSTWFEDDSLVLGEPGGGHGGSVLARAQWEVFALFAGKTQSGKLPRGQSNQLASLEDIAPTILALADVGSTSRPAMAVAQAARGATVAAAPLRDYVVLETGFRPAGLDMTAPQMSAALRIAESSFDVMPDGRVEMKPAAFTAAMEDKDYSVTDGVHALSLVRSADRYLLVSDDFSSNSRSVFTLNGVAAFKPPPLIDAACKEPALRKHLGNSCAIH